MLQLVHHYRHLTLPCVDWDLKAHEGKEPLPESKPADPQVIEWCQQNHFCQLPHHPLHHSSAVYLAQLDGQAWRAHYIIIQTGILKATWNARDCARFRWQFAGWIPTLQSAGQQATSGDGSSPWAGEGCVCVHDPPLPSHWVSPFSA